MRILSVLTLFFLLACDGGDPTRNEPAPDAEVGDGDGDGDGDADAEVIELPEVERRDAPECEPLEGKSIALESFHVTTDFFAGCNGTVTDGLPDRAFTWTAPETGLYELSMGPGNIWEARSSLGIRWGDCALTEQEAPSSVAPGEIVCAGSYLTENGSSGPYQVLRLTEGDTLTLVVEGDDYFFLPETDALRRQALSLSVRPFACPTEQAPELAGATLPAQTSFRSTAPSDHVILDIACADTDNTRQHALEWTAPEAGRYTFSARQEGTDDAVAIALLDDTCLGDELACEQGDGDASTALEMVAGQRVVVFVEIEAFSDDDAEITVRIERE